MLYKQNWYIHYKPLSWLQRDNQLFPEVEKMLGGSMLMQEGDLKLECLYKALWKEQFLSTLSCDNNGKK